MHRLDGEYDECLKSFARLTRLDPAAGVISSYNRARVFLYKNMFAEAYAELDKGAKIEPNHPMVRIFRAAVLFHDDQIEKALEVIRKVLENNPQMDGIRPILATFLASQGKTEEARAQLTAETLNLAKADHDMAYWMCETSSQLGDIDAAFKWLEKAIKLGNENKPWFETDKTLAPIRKDPRFKELMDKIGH